MTGAGSGLGRTYAIDLAARGAMVVVNDIGTGRDGVGHSPQAADQVVAEIVEAGGNAVASHDSVSSAEGGKAIAETALSTFGRIDILINNAGILRNAPFEEIDAARLDAVIDNQLKAAFYTTQPAYRVMKQQKYGRIIFVSSAAGLFGNEWQSNYAAAKAGVVGLMNVLGMEAERHGVLVNTLLPLASTRSGSDYSPEFIEDVTPVLNKLGNGNHPLNVTPLVTYLASDQCKTTRGIYSAVGRRYARVFIGVSDGWLGSAEGFSTAEDIAENFGKIFDVSRYSEPRSVFEEIARVVAARESLKP